VQRETKCNESKQGQRRDCATVQPQNAAQCEDCMCTQLGAAAMCKCQLQLCNQPQEKPKLCRAGACVRCMAAGKGASPLKTNHPKTNKCKTCGCCGPTRSNRSARSTPPQTGSGSRALQIGSDHRQIGPSACWRAPPLRTLRQCRPGGGRLYAADWIGSASWTVLVCSGIRP
jgi:hypothetical protein